MSNIQRLLIQPETLWCVDLQKMKYNQITAAFHLAFLCMQILHRIS